MKRCTNANDAKLQRECTEWTFFIKKMEKHLSVRPLNIKFLWNKFKLDLIFEGKDCRCDLKMGEFLLFPSLLFWQSLQFVGIKSLWHQEWHLVAESTLVCVIINSLFMRRVQRQIVAHYFRLKANLFLKSPTSCPFSIPPLVCYSPILKKNTDQFLHPTCSLRFPRGISGCLHSLNTESSYLCTNVHLRTN